MEIFTEDNHKLIFRSETDNDKNIYYSDSKQYNFDNLSNNSKSSNNSLDKSDDDIQEYSNNNVKKNEIEVTYFDDESIKSNDNNDNYQGNNYLQNILEFVGVGKKKKESNNENKSELSINRFINSENVKKEYENSYTIEENFSDEDEFYNNDKIREGNKINEKNKVEKINRMESIYEDYYDEHSTTQQDMDCEVYLFSKYLQNEDDKLELIKKDNNKLTKDNNLLLCSTKNDFDGIKKCVNNGATIYKKLVNEKGNLINSLCLENNIDCNRCNECHKTCVYHSFRNTNRGIKTIYDHLLKFLIIEKKFRIYCDCCKDYTISTNLERMNEAYKKKENITEIGKNLSPKKKMELEINFYTNKFMQILSFLDCQCKFLNNKNKKNYYFENFLNFSLVYEVYLRTIPNLIKLLKEYYSIKQNNEELYLINDDRCIHDEIPHYNILKYCKKKESHFNNKINNNLRDEIIMKIENVNLWMIKSLKSSMLLLNEQSLELLNYELLKRFDNKKNYVKIFESLYRKSNTFIDLDHKLENDGIIKIILKCDLDEIKKIRLVNIFIEQYKNRNKRYRKNFEEIMINYTKECIEYGNYYLAIEFLKQVKNNENINKEDYNIYKALEYIFDNIIGTSKLNIEKKISFLKVINKNKINVCEYDFINNLIDCENGDEIILGFNKISNNLFNITNYNDEHYVIDIIKKCIIKIKKNILDYCLHNLKKIIKTENINSVNIYLFNIKKKENFNNLYKTYENNYIELLKIILNYEDQLSKDKYYSAISYCIENELRLSAKLFIQQNFIKDDKLLLIESLTKNDHIILESLIERNNTLINYKYENLNLLNLLFKKINSYDVNKNFNSTTLSNLNNFENCYENLFIRMIKKILKPIITQNISSDIINYDDENNQSFGFLLLNCKKISKENKIYLFNYTKYFIEPMKINNYYDKKIYKKNTKNIPLILYSLLQEQYEITFILLNNLIRENRIDKIKKENNSFFDNYCLDDELNINIIPIVVKYLTDNRKFHENFDENKIGGINNMLSIDFYCVQLILICMFFISQYFLFFENKNVNTKNTIIKNNFNKSNFKKINIDKNKYKEIENKNKNKNNFFNTDDISDFNIYSEY